MPFCTACGRQNPDDARFCSQCGTRLVTPADVPAPASAEPLGESTATIQIGLGDAKVETSDRQLNPVDAAAVDALPTGHALLVVQRGPGSGSRFLLDSDVVYAGRHPESEIFLDDVTVSRNHALLVRRGEEVYIDDLGSLNGTYVNRQRIESQKLEDGDEIQVGKYKLSFIAEGMD